LIAAINLMLAVISLTAHF